MVVFVQITSVGGALIGTSNVAATNGLIHFIDKVKRKKKYYKNNTQQVFLYLLPISAFFFLRFWFPTEHWVKVCWPRSLSGRSSHSSDRISSYDLSNTLTPCLNVQCFLTCCAFSGFLFRIIIWPMISNRLTNSPSLLRQTPPSLSTWRKWQPLPWYTI